MYFFYSNLDIYLFVHNFEGNFVTVSFYENGELIGQGVTLLNITLFAHTLNSEKNKIR